MHINNISFKQNLLTFRSQPSTKEKIPVAKANISRKQELKNIRKRENNAEVKVMTTTILLILIYEMIRAMLSGGRG